MYTNHTHCVQRQIFGVMAWASSISLDAINIAIKYMMGGNGVCFGPDAKPLAYW